VIVLYIWKCREAADLFLDPLAILGGIVIMINTHWLRLTHLPKSVDIFSCFLVVVFVVRTVSIVLNAVGAGGL
jgi:hypothetical protein